MELHSKKNNCWLLICIVSLLFLTGCTGSKASDQPKTVPVSGTVMYNNQPVEGAEVSFMAPGAPQAAAGRTDKEGKFQLSTFDPNDGAVIGEHVVTITKMEAGAATSKKSDEDLLNNPAGLAGLSSSEEESGSGGPKHLLPEKYSNATTSQLKETVTEAGPNKFVFNLAD